jgi:hypothetical protein
LPVRRAEVGGARQPINFLAGRKSYREDSLGRLRGTPRGFRRGLGLRERQARVIEESASSGGQFDAMHAAGQQGHADFIF